MHGCDAVALPNCVRLPPMLRMPMRRGGRWPTCTHAGHEMWHLTLATSRRRVAGVAGRRGEPHLPSCATTPQCASVRSSLMQLRSSYTLQESTDIACKGVVEPLLNAMQRWWEERDLSFVDGKAACRGATTELCAFLDEVDLARQRDPAKVGSFVDSSVLAALLAAAATTSSGPSTMCGALLNLCLPTSEVASASKAGGASLSSSSSATEGAVGVESFEFRVIHTIVNSALSGSKGRTSDEWLSVRHRPIIANGGVVEAIRWTDLGRRAQSFHLAHDDVWQASDGEASPTANDVVLCEAVTAHLARMGMVLEQHRSIIKHEGGRLPSVANNGASGEGWCDKRAKALLRSAVDPIPSLTVLVNLLRNKDVFSVYRRRKAGYLRQREVVDSETLGDCWQAKKLRCLVTTFANVLKGASDVANELLTLLDRRGGRSSALYSQLRQRANAQTPFLPLTRFADLLLRVTGESNVARAVVTETCELIASRSSLRRAASADESVLFGWLRVATTANFAPPTVPSATCKQVLPVGRGADIYYANTHALLARLPRISSSCSWAEALRIASWWCHRPDGTLVPCVRAVHASIFLKAMCERQELLATARSRDANLPLAAATAAMAQNFESAVSSSPLESDRCWEAALAAVNRMLQMAAVSRRSSTTLPQEAFAGALFLAQHGGWEAVCAVFRAGVAATATTGETIDPPPYKINAHVAREVCSSLNRCQAPSRVAFDVFSMCATILRGDGVGYMACQFSAMTCMSSDGQWESALFVMQRAVSEAARGALHLPHHPSSLAPDESSFSPRKAAHDIFTRVVAAAIGPNGSSPGPAPHWTSIVALLDTVEAAVLASSPGRYDAVATSGLPREGLAALCPLLLVATTRLAAFLLTCRYQEDWMAEVSAGCGGVGDRPTARHAAFVDAFNRAVAYEEGDREARSAHCSGAPAAMGGSHRVLMLTMGRIREHFSMRVTAWAMAELADYCRELARRSSQPARALLGIDHDDIAEAVGEFLQVSSRKDRRVGGGGSEIADAVTTAVAGLASPQSLLVRHVVHSRSARTAPRL